MKNRFSFRPNTWDLAIYNCVVTHNEYLLPTSFGSADVIIDIGAHIGSFAHACLERGCEQVLSFEAFPDNYELAHQNLLQYGYKANVQNKAVWRSDVNVPHLLFTPSTHEVNTGGGNVWSEGGQLEVATVGLDEVIQSVGKRIRLLKLDCEGSEFPILFTCTKLDQVDSICGEYHEMNSAYNSMAIPEGCQIEGYPNFSIEALESFLKEQGFTHITHTRSNDTNGNPTNLGLFFASRG